MRGCGRLCRELDEELRLPLTVLSGCFLVGSGFGLLFSGRAVDAGSGMLIALLRTFFEQAAGAPPQAAPLPVLLWEGVRWHALVFVLGFTSLGLLFLPVVFVARGFLLSFAVAAFIRAFGGGGAVAALAVFGVTGAISLPALFVLGVQGMVASRALASRFLGEDRRGLPYGRTYFLRCAGCAGGLVVCVLLESSAVPVLVSGTAGLLSLP